MNWCGSLAPQLFGALWRSQLPEAVERQLAAVEQADVLVVATPVYRGSYTGLFKHFFDFIHQDALVDTPILLAATGGSERHALVIDHQLRPLFSFFQARTLPLGVYATDRDFADGRVHNEALMQRARLAVQRAMPLLAPSPIAQHLFSHGRCGLSCSLNADCHRPAFGCDPATRNATHDDRRLYLQHHAHPLQRELPAR